jgi:hypothetical protein
MVQAIQTGGDFVSLFYTLPKESGGKNILRHYELEGNDARHLQSIEFSEDEDEKIEIAGTYIQTTERETTKVGQHAFIARGKNKFIRFSVFDTDNGAPRSTFMGVSASYNDTDVSTSGDTDVGTSLNYHILKNTALPRTLIPVPWKTPAQDVKYEAPEDHLSRGNFGCKGGKSCCTSTNKCDVNEGDCDADGDCMDGLKCGSSNCYDTDANTFFLTDDCCEVP